MPGEALVLVFADELACPFAIACGEVAIPGEDIGFVLLLECLTGDVLAEDRRRDSGVILLLPGPLEQFGRATEPAEAQAREPVGLCQARRRDAVLAHARDRW